MFYFLTLKINKLLAHINPTFLYTQTVIVFENFWKNCKLPQLNLHEKFACCINACRDIFCEIWKIQGSCMEKSCKISLQHAKILQNLHTKYLRDSSEITFQTVISVLHINKVVPAICDLSTSRSTNKLSSKLCSYFILLVQINCINLMKLVLSIQHFNLVLFSENFIFRTKILSENAKMSYFYIQRNIRCI